MKGNFYEDYINKLLSCIDSNIKVNLERPIEEIAADIEDILKVGVLLGNREKNIFFNRERWEQQVRTLALDVFQDLSDLFLLEMEEVILIPDENSEIAEFIMPDLVGYDVEQEIDGVTSYFLPSDYDDYDKDNEEADEYFKSITVNKVKATLESAVTLLSNIDDTGNTDNLESHVVDSLIAQHISTIEDELESQEDEEQRLHTETVHTVDGEELTLFELSFYEEGVDYEYVDSDTVEIFGKQEENSSSPEEDATLDFLDEEGEEEPYETPEEQESEESEEEAEESFLEEEEESEEAFLEEEDESEDSFLDEEDEDESFIQPEEEDEEYESPDSFLGEEDDEPEISHFVEEDEPSHSFLEEEGDEYEEGENGISFSAHSESLQSTSFTEQTYNPFSYAEDSSEGFSVTNEKAEADSRVLEGNNVFNSASYEEENEDFEAFNHRAASFSERREQWKAENSNVETSWDTFNQAESPSTPAWGNSFEAEDGHNNLTTPFSFDNSNFSSPTPQFARDMPQLGVNSPSKEVVVSSQNKSFAKGLERFGNKMLSFAEKSKRAVNEMVVEEETEK